MRALPFLAALAGLVLGSSAGLAAPVVGTFSGALDADDLATFSGDVFGTPASDFHVGDTVSGTVTYDPALMTHVSIPTLDHYSGSPVKFDFHIGAHDFSFGPGNLDNLGLLPGALQSYGANSENSAGGIDTAVWLTVVGSGLYTSSQDLTSVNFHSVEGLFSFENDFVDPVGGAVTTLGGFAIKVAVTVPATLPATVPIPGSLLLLVSSLAGLGVAAQRWKATTALDSHA